MKALTIKDLSRLIIRELDRGHGDYIVFVTDDKEGNGYHALWYEGESPETMDIITIKEVERINHDICLVERGKNSKAYYLG